MYYIEICEKDNTLGYVIQSDFFNTENDCLEWFEKITFLDTCQYKAYLMCSENNEDRYYTDIKCVREL